MTKKYKFVLNRSGVRKLLNSDEMRKILSKKADEVLHDINKEGYEKGEIYSGENRPNIDIFCTTYEAKKDNLKNNTLEKALNRVKRND